MSQNKTILISLLVIIGVAGYLRLYNLGLSSFWVDELDFVVAAESMKESGEPLLYSGYAYPRSPLFTYSVMASTALFGVSEFSSRLPSAIFGILAVLAAFWIGKDLFNTRVGLISALLLAISPFALGWSRTCRMYALFQLLFMVGIYFFYRGFEWRQHGTGERGSKAFKWLPRKLQSILNEWGIHLPWLLLGGLFLMLSYSTHANAGLFLLTFVAYLLLHGVVDLVKNGARTAFRNKYLVLASAILGLGLLSYGLLPGVREFISYSVFYQPKWAEVVTAQNKWRIIEFFMGPQKFPFDWLFCVGATLMLIQKSRAGIFILLTFLIPVLMFSFVFQYRKNDYIFHVYPIFYLVGAFALDYLVGVAGRLIDRLRSKRILTGLLAGSRGETLVLALCFLWIPLTFNFRFAQKIPRQPDGHFNGAIYHNEWQELAAFVREKVSQQDVLMSTLPLTVRHYLGRAEFNLNWSNGDLAAQNKNYAGDGRLIDFYSGADVIEDLDELKKTMRDHPNGWLLVDNYRFDNSVYVPEDVRQYLSQRAAKVFESRNRTVSAYQWTESSYMSGTN